MRRLAAAAPAALVILLATASLVAQERPDDDAIELTPVEVEGTRLGPAPVIDDAPRRVEALESGTLVRRNVRSLADAAAWLAGGAPVSPTSTGQGLVVDGLPAGQLTVLLDGVPISRPQGSPEGPLVDLTAIGVDPEQIERIELYRGGGPPGSGVAAGVALNIVTRREPQPFSAYARASLGSELTALADQAYAAGASGELGGGWSLRGRAGADLREALDLNGDDIYDMTESTRIDAELGADWHGSGGDALRLGVLGGWRTIASLGNVRAPLYDEVETTRVDVLADGRWHPLPALRIDHATRLGWYDHAFRKIVRESGYERPRADTEELALRQTVAATGMFDLHDLGGELVLEGSRVTRTGQGGAFEPVLEGRAVLGVSERVYATDWLTVEGRLLGELSSAFGADVAAELALSVRPVESLVLRAQGSRTRRLPTAEERFLFFDHSELGYQIDGNPSLEPETLYGARLGLGWTPLAVLGIELEGFYNHLYDLVDTAPVGVPAGGSVATFSYMNRARAHTGGLNASVRLSELPGGLSLAASYAWLALAEDFDSGEHLTLRAEHSARAELAGRWFDGMLEAWVDLATRSSLRVPQGSVAAPAYALVGAGVAYQPWEVLRLVVDADNLLDQRNATWGPKPGFHLMFTLEARFDLEAPPDAAVAEDRP